MVKSYNFFKAELGGSLDKFDRINFSKLKFLKMVISPFFLIDTEKSYFIEKDASSNKSVLSLGCLD